MVGKKKIEWSVIQDILNKQRKKLYFSLLKTGAIRLIFFSLAPYTLFWLIDLAFDLSVVSRFIFLSILLISTGFLFFKFFIISTFRYYSKTAEFSDKNIAKIFINSISVQDKLLTFIELNELKADTEYVLEALTSYVKMFEDFSKKSVDYQLYRFDIKFKIITITLTVFILLINSLPTARIAQQRLLFPSKDISYKYLDIELINFNSNLIEGSSVDIFFRLKGNYIPQEIYLHSGNIDYSVKKINDTLWTFRFDNVVNTINFYLYDRFNRTKNYTINVIRLPKLLDIQVLIFPPKYTGLEPVFLNGNGNFVYPENSKIQLLFRGANTTRYQLIIKSDTIFSDNQNQLEYQLSPKGQFNYKLYLYNDTLLCADNYFYTATEKKDMFPEIFVESDFDKFNYSKPVMFKGRIADDYGFNKLLFIVETKDEKYEIPLPISKNTIVQSFFYQFTINDILSLTNSTEIEAWFEIYDNDEFNGFKSSKTRTFTFSLPSSDELSQQNQQLTDDLKTKLSLSLDLLKQLNLERKNLDARMKTEKLSEWEKKQLNEALNKNTQELNNLMQQIKSLSDQLRNLNDFDKGISEELRIKNEEIMALMEKLLDNELLELFKQLDELKRDLLDKSKDGKSLSTEQLQKMMDRNLELLKRYEIEKGIQDITSKMMDLAQKLEMATDIDERENIESQVENMMEQHNQLLEKNRELKKPFDINDFNQQKSQLKQDLRSNDNNTNSSKENKRNAQKTQEFAQMMAADFQMKNNRSDAEDLENLRQLRSNLLNLSYAQEDVVNLQLKTAVSKQNKSILIMQKKVMDKWSIIEDSILSLSSRNAGLAVLTDEEFKYISSLKKQLDNNWNTENPAPTLVLDQRILTHFNNLLLFIDEAIQRAEQSMANAGSGGCQRPGKSKPSPEDMAKSQGQLKQSLQNMINQMKSAKDGRGMSEQLGQYLSEQEKFNSYLQQMINTGQIGSQARELLKEASKLIEENLQDVLNKRLSNETILRHERIITRLLEAEKAEKERKIDEKRESRENRKDFFRAVEQVTIDTVKNSKIDDNLNYRLLHLTKYYLDLYQHFINTDAN